MILTPKKSTCEMFFAKLFEISETAKAIHLQQKSKNGFVHSAMGDLYSQASGLADKIYETYCGLYGTCVISFGSKPSDTEPLGYVKSCYNYIDSNRKDSPLVKAKDAIEIDNSDLTLQEQFDKILQLVEMTIESLE